MTQKQFLPLQLNFGEPTDSPVTYAVAYQEVGAGFPLVMLHGFMGDSDCWLPLMHQLAPHFRCISLDLLGFGDSAKPALRYDVAKEVAFVHQALQALELDRFYLLGHSFGGWVAAAYTLAHPNAVEALMLAAPAGIRDDSFCGRYDALRPLLWPTPIVDWVLTLAQPMAHWLGKKTDLDRIAWFRQALNQQPAARSFLVDRLRPEDAIDTVEQAIHRLRVPTLVITGDRDETIPLWHSETYAREIPQAQLIVLADADHALPQNHAAALSAKILAWEAIQPSTHRYPLASPDP